MRSKIYSGASPFSHQVLLQDSSEQLFVVVCCWYSFALVFCCTPMNMCWWCIWCCSYYNPFQVQPTFIKGNTMLVFLVCIALSLKSTAAVLSCPSRLILIKWSSLNRNDTRHYIIQDSVIMELITAVSLSVIYKLKAGHFKRSWCCRPGGVRQRLL